MHRVFLFGSRDIYGVPMEAVKQLEDILKITNGDVQFIVGDAPGIDASFHKVLSGIGAASKSLIYCMDYARNNVYDFELKTFKSKYDPSNETVTISCENEEPTVFTHIKKPDDLRFNREFYEFKDKQMRNDCTFAICIWDGKSKGTFTNINVLKAQGKYVYIYRV